MSLTEFTLLDPELVASLNGKLRTADAMTLHIMGGRSRGWTSTSLYGDACDYLDTSQQKMNTPTSGQTLYLVSTSANDAAAGSGARTVHINYLDTNGDMQSVYATLNGTTPVSIGSGFTAIQLMEVQTLGTANGEAAGDITISSTNGVATVATTFELIAAGGNRSISGRFKIPKGWTGYTRLWNACSISARMDVRLRATCCSWDRTLTPNVYHFQDRIQLAADTCGTGELPWLKFPALCDLKVSAIPGATQAGNKLEADFSILLVKG